MKPWYLYNSPTGATQKVKNNFPPIFQLSIAHKNIYCIYIYIICSILSHQFISILVSNLSHSPGRCASTYCCAPSLALQAVTFWGLQAPPSPPRKSSSRAQGWRGKKKAVSKQKKPAPHQQKKKSKTWLVDGSWPSWNGDCSWRYRDFAEDVPNLQRGIHHKNEV